VKLSAEHSELLAGPAGIAGTTPAL